MIHLTKSQLECRLRELLAIMVNTKDRQTLADTHLKYLVADNQYRQITGHTYNFEKAKRRYK